MKIKVSEATKLQLDWLVAKCEGVPWSADGFFEWNTPGYPTRYSKECPSYSTDWAQGGPIIEREGISIVCIFFSPQVGNDCQATGFRDDQDVTVNGPTPLIAAMRCYVASKLGDEVEVPDELC